MCALRSGDDKGERERGRTHHEERRDERGHFGWASDEIDRSRTWQTLFCFRSRGRRLPAAAAEDGACSVQRKRGLVSLREREREKEKESTRSSLDSKREKRRKSRVREIFSFRSKQESKRASERARAETTNRETIERDFTSVFSLVFCPLYEPAFSPAPSLHRERAREINWNEPAPLSPPAFERGGLKSRRE